MPVRRTAELHVHRWPAPYVRYFVTCCTQDRCDGLHRPSVVDVLRRVISNADRLGDTETYAFTIMPDHIHWLFRSGGRLSLGRIVARLKAKTRQALALEGLKWQRDFFEHRLRAEESIEDYGRYVLLNPYRAGIAKSGEVWPGWWAPRPEMFRFTALLEGNGSPPAKWIGEPDPVQLAVGE